MYFLKVKGDNYRCTKDEEQGAYTFEIGYNLFHKNPKGDSYHELDKWWLVDFDEIVRETNDPVVVKITSKRSNFIFKDKLLE